MGPQIPHCQQPELAGLQRPTPPCPPRFSVTGLSAQNVCERPWARALTAHARACLFAGWESRVPWGSPTRAGGDSVLAESALLCAERSLGTL